MSYKDTTAGWPDPALSYYNQVSNSIDRASTGHWSTSHRNIAISCKLHGTGGLDKMTIARLFNLRVHEYNSAIKDTSAHSVLCQVSFDQIRDAA